MLREGRVDKHQNLGIWVFRILCQDLHIPFPLRGHRHRAVSQELSRRFNFIFLYFIHPSWGREPDGSALQEETSQQLLPAEFTNPAHLRLGCSNGIDTEWVENRIRCFVYTGAVVTYPQSLAPSGSIVCFSSQPPCEGLIET